MSKTFTGGPAFPADSKLGGDGSMERHRRRGKSWKCMAYGYAELLALVGGSPEALTEPYRLTAAGITFEPDPAVWRTLTDEERLEIRPAGWTPGEPILAFPFSAAELLRFVEKSALPALARWCEQDENDPTAFAMLEFHPLGHGLAIFLAGGPDPTPGAQPAAGRRRARDRAHPRRQATEPLTPTT